MIDHAAAGVRLLVRLEIPDRCACPPATRKPLPCSCDEPCDCPVHLPPPCGHILARDHALSLAEWAELLVLVLPEDYTEPPPPTAPALALTRAARQAVYAERLEGGRHLYHDRDLWRRQPVDDTLKTGCAAIRVMNGYLDPDQRLAVAGRVGPEEATPTFIAAILGEMGPLQRGLFERGRRLAERRERRVA